MEQKRRGSGMARTVSLRISEAMAASLEDERIKIARTIGTNLSASEVVRHTLEVYLQAAGHAVTITPWPSAPLEDKVKLLEAEVERLRRLVPDEQAQPFFQ